MVPGKVNGGTSGKMAKIRRFLAKLSGEIKENPPQHRKIMPINACVSHQHRESIAIFATTRHKR
jgi:hypothetical protein